MNNKTLAAISLIGIAILGVYFMFAGVNSTLGGSQNFTPFAKMKVSTGVLVGTSDTLVQASSSRQYIVIVNDGSNPVYLGLNGDAPSEAYKGIRLNANGGAYEICQDCDNLYSGAIRATAVGGTATVTVSSY